MRLPPADTDPLGTQEPEPLPPLPYAGLFRRLIAFLIDLILAMIVFALIAIVVAFLMGLAFPASEFDDATSVRLWRDHPDAIRWLAILFIYVGYFAFFEARSGATPGKQRLGLRVTTDYGHPIDWSASIMRNLIRPFDVLGGFLFAVRGRHRRLGDRAANTVVLNSRAATWPE